MIKRLICNHRVALFISTLFLTIGFLLGFLLHDWVWQVIIGQPIPPALSSTEFCEMASLGSGICSSKTIDPMLQQKIKGTFQMGTEQTLFPMNVRVEVTDDFEPGTSFPKEQYKFSSTVYSVTVVSPEELRILIEMEGIKNISEFETIYAN